MQMTVCPMVGDTTDGQDRDGMGVGVLLVLDVGVGVGGVVTDADVVLLVLLTTGTLAVLLLVLDVLLTTGTMMGTLPWVDCTVAVTVLPTGAGGRACTTGPAPATGMTGALVVKVPEV